MTKQSSRTIKSNSNNMAKNSGVIRIIGGKWRGRKLPVMDSIGLRPTTDRIKETLFNWLMSDITDAYCLDCYAGSGSLGFEAISRGAAQATLIEQNRSIAQQLEKNRVALNTDAVTIINTNVLELLSKKANTSFNLVFIDPPFNQDLVQSTINNLVSNEWLSPQAWIYIETEINNTPLITPNNWQLYREKQAGQVSYRLYFQDNE